MKRLLLTVGTVAMIAGLGACNRANAGPAGVAEEFMRKLDSGNCTGLGEYLSASSQAIAPKLEQGCTMQASQKKATPGKTLSSVNVVEQTENGDRATVRLEAVYSDGTKEGGTEALVMVRENGRWKIDLLGTGMGAANNAGGSPAAPTMTPTPMPGAPTAPTMTPATPTMEPATPDATPTTEAPEGAEEGGEAEKPAQ